MTGPFIFRRIWLGCLETACLRRRGWASEGGSEWAREGQSQREKKEMAVLLRGRKAEYLWKLSGKRNELWVSRDICNTHSHTHTCSGHGCYSCVFCLCALCTHAWTHLPLPTNLLCVMCKRDISSPTLIFEPLIGWVVARSRTERHVCLSVHHAAHAVCVTTANLHPHPTPPSSLSNSHHLTHWWQGPYCQTRESYARTPLTSGPSKRLIWNIKASLFARGDELAACGLLVIGNCCSLPLLEHFLACVFFYFGREQTPFALNSNTGSYLSKSQKFTHDLSIAKLWNWFFFSFSQMSLKSFYTQNLVVL